MGQLIGTGPGRGVALMYIILSVLLIGLALGSLSNMPRGWLFYKQRVKLVPNRCACRILGRLAPKAEPSLRTRYDAPGIIMSAIVQVGILIVVALGIYLLRWVSI